MALSMKELEEKWPEGPVFTYRFAMEHIAAFSDGTMCPAKLPEAQKCWDLRMAIIGLLRLEAHRIESVRGEVGLTTKTWLMTSRQVNYFCCIFLEGVR